MNLPDRKQLSFLFKLNSRTTGILPPRPAATLLAGALVSVLNATEGPCELPGSSLWQLIALVAIVGALGGLTHSVSSFGTFVGNNSLKASWLWWYALKPVLSALVAVIVFLVFRAGLGTPDLGLGAGECLTVAGFAALVGLFADQATLKLKDIFDALFTPRSDPRKDKAEQSTSNVPVIDGVDSQIHQKIGRQQNHNQGQELYRGLYRSNRRAAVLSDLAFGFGNGSDNPEGYFGGPKTCGDCVEQGRQSIEFGDDRGDIGNRPEVTE